MQTSPAYLPHTNSSRGILDSIGSTPLVEMRSYLDRGDVHLFGKLEAANPGGSAKDRPALAMIDTAIAAGEIGAETTIIESSSGNMGIGLAQVCGYYGLRFVCVVDPNAQPDNVAIIKALGGEVEEIREPLDGDYLAARLSRVCELLENMPDSYWPNQYGNHANPRAHRDGTIRELDDELGDSLDVLFVATSSTGTIRGCREYLESRGRSTTIVAVDAVGSVLFNGERGRRVIPGLGAGRIPKLAQNTSHDILHRVTTRDCVVGCRRAASREAFLPGGSAGGVLEAVRAKQDDLAGLTVAAILHDSGTRYLDTIYSDRWVECELGEPIESITEEVRSSPKPSKMAACQCS